MLIITKAHEGQQVKCGDGSRWTVLCVNERTRESHPVILIDYSTFYRIRVTSEGKFVSNKIFSRQDVIEIIKGDKQC